jgi:hypothetical protein
MRLAPKYSSTERQQRNPAPKDSTPSHESGF